MVDLGMILYKKQFRHKEKWQHVLKVMLDINLLCAKN